MVSDNAKEVFIQGITQDGRTFRPSDWAERLAGVMSSFRPGGAQPGSHLSYSPWCVPTVINGIKCVIVNRELRDLSPWPGTSASTSPRTTTCKWARLACCRSGDDKIVPRGRRCTACMTESVADVTGCQQSRAIRAIPHEKAARRRLFTFLLCWQRTRVKRRRP
jgi:hypothetical protein